MRFLKGFQAAIVLAAMTPACGTASATSVYIAQNAAASANGSSCANAYEAYAFFNSSGNWGTGAGQIGPGTTVHFCGTISYGLKAYGSGTSGNPITLLWEPGAVFSSTGTTWNVQAPITLDGQSYFVINGGLANTGGAAANITATGNGSGLSTQLAVIGIHMNGSSNVEIKNFGCANLYVHTSTSDHSIGSDSSPCVYANPQGTNVSIHDSTFHDNQDGILFPGASAGTTSLQLYNMNMYNMDHFLFTSCNSSTSSGWYVHDNQFLNPVAWDTTTNSYHHDGWIMNINTGQTCDQIYVYNNLFGGDWGANSTSPLFFDQNGGGAAAVDNTYIFNNVFLNTDTRYPWANGIALEVYPGPVHFWNNTIVCPTVGGSSMEVISLNLDIRNNVESGCQNFYTTSNATSPTISVSAFDYNYYANLISSGNAAFAYISSNSGSGSLATEDAAWVKIIQGQLAGAELHSGQGSSAGLSSSGAPQAGSAVISNGVNLCSIVSCTGNLTALASDTSAGNTRTPTRRPASGPWDIGAFVYSTAGASGAPAPPANITIAVQ